MSGGPDELGGSLESDSGDGSGQLQPEDEFGRRVAAREEAVSQRPEEFTEEDISVSGRLEGVQAGVKESAARREAVEATLEAAGEGFTEEDVVVEETDGGAFQARISQAARRRELEASLLEQRRGDFTDEDVRIAETDDGLEARLSESALEQRRQAQREDLIEETLADAPEGVTREDIDVEQTGDGFRASVDSDALPEPETTVQQPDVDRELSEQEREELVEDALERQPDAVDEEDIQIERRDDKVVASVDQETRTELAREQAIEGAVEQIDEQTAADITRDDVEVVQQPGPDTEGRIELSESGVQREQQAQERLESVTAAGRQQDLIQRSIAEAGAAQQLEEQLAQPGRDGFETEDVTQPSLGPMIGDGAQVEGVDVDLSATDVIVEGETATLTETGRQEVAEATVERQQEVASEEIAKRVDAQTAVEIGEEDIEFTEARPAQERFSERQLERFVDSERLIQESEQPVQRAQLTGDVQQEIEAAQETRREVANRQAIRQISQARPAGSVTTAADLERQVRSQVEEDTGTDLSEEAVEVVETDEGARRARLSERGLREVAAEDLSEQTGREVEPSQIDIVETEEGRQAELDEDAFQRDEGLGNIEETKEGRQFFGGLEDASQFIKEDIVQPAGEAVSFGITTAQRPEIAGVQAGTSIATGDTGEAIDIPREQQSKAARVGEVAITGRGGLPGAGLTINVPAGVSGLVRAGDVVGAGLEAAAPSEIATTAEVIGEGFDVPVEAETESEFGQLATIEEGNLEDFALENEPITVGIAEGGFVGEAETRGGQAAGAIVEQTTESFQEAPIETTAALGGALVGTAAATRGAQAISPTAGRAVPFAFQPGEELLTAGATATLGRTATGQRILRRFPGEKIDNEEIFLREAAKIGRGTRKRLKPGTRTDTSLGIKSGLRNLRDRTPNVELEVDADAGFIEVDPALKRQARESVESRVGSAKRSLSVDVNAPELSLERVRDVGDPRNVDVRSKLGGASSRFETELERVRRPDAKTTEQTLDTISRGGEIEMGEVPDIDLRQAAPRVSPTQAEFTLAEIGELGAPTRVSARARASQFRSGLSDIGTINPQAAEATLSRVGDIGTPSRPAFGDVGVRGRLPSAEATQADIRLQELGEGAPDIPDRKELRESARRAAVAPREFRTGFAFGSGRAEVDPTTRMNRPLDETLPGRAFGAGARAGRAEARLQETLSRGATGLRDAPVATAEAIRNIPDLTLRVRPGRPATLPPEAIRFETKPGQELDIDLPEELRQEFDFTDPTETETETEVESETETSDDDIGETIDVEQTPGEPRAGQTGVAVQRVVRTEAETETDTEAATRIKPLAPEIGFEDATAASVTATDVSDFADRATDVRSRGTVEQELTTGIRDRLRRTSRPQVTPEAGQGIASTLDVAQRSELQERLGQEAELEQEFEQELETEQEVELEREIGVEQELEEDVEERARVRQEFEQEQEQEAEFEFEVEVETETETEPFIPDRLREPGPEDEGPTAGDVQDIDVFEVGTLGEIEQIEAETLDGFETE